jgi:hypothetical protein
MAVTERAGQVKRQAMPVSHSARARWWRSPWAVAGCALMVYALWIATYLFAGHDIRDFINVGTRFVRQSDVSPVIRVDPTYQYRSPDGIGYDGQFAYYIALDPPNARYYMDFPAYRYTRILYPMLARLLSGGQPTLTPYVMVAINWLAVGAATLALAAWLKRRGRSPWLALIYSFSIGLFTAMQADLNEPLAFACLAAAIYLFDFGGSRRALWAGACFALALLARETSAVFAALYGLALLLEGASWESWRQRLAVNWRPAALLLGVAFAPLALYKTFLTLWLGSAGIPEQVRFEIIPFGGIISSWPWDGHRLVEVEGVVLPALICLGLVLFALRRAPRSVTLWSLLVNILFFVVLIPRLSFTDIFASSRLSTGVIFAALYCLPTFDAQLRGKRLWLVATTALWSAFLPVLMLAQLTH